MGKHSKASPGRRWRKCQSCGGRCTVLVPSTDPKDNGKMVRVTCSACGGAGGAWLGNI